MYCRFRPSLRKMLVAYQEQITVLQAQLQQPDQPPQQALFPLLPTTCGEPVCMAMLEKFAGSMELHCGFQCQCDNFFLPTTGYVLWGEHQMCVSPILPHGKALDIFIFCKSHQGSAWIPSRSEPCLPESINSPCLIPRLQRDMQQRKSYCCTSSSPMGLCN